MLENDELIWGGAKRGWPSRPPFVVKRDRKRILLSFGTDDLRASDVRRQGPSS